MLSSRHGAGQEDDRQHRVLLSRLDEHGELLSVDEHCPVARLMNGSLDAARMESELARRLELTFQHIQQWRRVGQVPAERVLQVEAAVGGKVSRHDLRPDVFGPAEGKAAA